MKRIIFISLLLMMAFLTACGQAGTPAPASEPAQKEEVTVQIANPWRDVSEEEAKAVYSNSFSVPEGAENAQWRVMESDGSPALVELDFDLYGITFTARQQKTDDRTADISGMYYDWEYTSSDIMRGHILCTTQRHIGEDGYADLCTWYDEPSGVSYSLGVTAADLDGFDIVAIAEAAFPEAQDEVDYEAAYQSVLDAYRKAYETGNNTAEYAFENDLSEFIDGSETGYALADLDRDGVPELLLGNPYGDADQILYDLYTLENGAPVRLCVSYARSRYYLLNDGRIFFEGSSGAQYSYLFVFEKKGTELSGLEGYITAPKGENDVYYYKQTGSVSYDPRPEDTEISADEFRDAWKDFDGKKLIPPMRPVQWQ